MRRENYGEGGMKVWVDADACPRAIKDIVFRASERTKVCVALVANGGMELPKSALVSLVLVPHGLNVADAHIAEQVDACDIVVTADVPLASLVVKKGAVAIDPRGRLYTEDSIGSQLASRDLLHSLRSREVIRGGGPSSFTPQDVQRFASALDKWLTKKMKGEKPQA
jgi:uncharacterized protein YaiI (UPF0178 family)